MQVLSFRKKRFNYLSPSWPDLWWDCGGKAGFMLWKKGCLPDSHLTCKEQLWLWNQPWVHCALPWMSEWRMDLGSVVCFSGGLCDVGQCWTQNPVENSPMCFVLLEVQVVLVDSEGDSETRVGSSWKGQTVFTGHHGLIPGNINCLCCSNRWNTSGIGELLQLSHTGISVKHRETLPCPRCLGYRVEIWGIRQSEFQQSHGSHEPFLKL